MKYKYPLRLITEIVWKIEQKKDKIYNKRDIRTEIIRYINKHPNIHPHREKIKTIFHYNDKFLQEILLNLDLSDLKYKTKEKILTEKYEQLQSDSYIISKNHYITQSDMLNFLSCKHERKVNEDKIEELLEYFDNVLFPVYICRHYSNLYVPCVVKYYPLDKARTIDTIISFFTTKQRGFVNDAQHHRHSELFSN